MRYAIFAATDQGCRTAAEAGKILLGQRGPAEQELTGRVDFFIHAKCTGLWQELWQQESAWSRAAGEKEYDSDNGNGISCWQKYFRLREVLPEAWGSYDALIFLMASGIVVRTMAPYLQSKLVDPAVLVMDDRGRNIISLLSGHVGGANRLTNYLAEAMEANPVITTATDGHALLAPDVVAGYIKAMPSPKENLRIFNGGLLKGQTVEYWLDRALPAVEIYEKILQREKLAYRLFDSSRPAWQEELRAEESLQVVITAQADKLPRSSHILYLQPRRLIAGVGCRRDTEPELLQQALAKACRSIGWSVGRIARLASTVVKADEKGLLQMAEGLSVPISFFANDELARQIEKYHLPESAFVKKIIGVGNICEAAALCCVERGSVALAKTKYEKVTVALIWEK